MSDCLEDMHGGHELMNSGCTDFSSWSSEVVMKTKNGIPCGCCSALFEEPRDTRCDVMCDAMLYYIVRRAVHSICMPAYEMLRNIRDVEPSHMTLKFKVVTPNALCSSRSFTLIFAIIVVGFDGS